MTLQQFTNMMENEFNAYWTSYYLTNRKDRELKDCNIGWDYNDERLNQDIVQIDSVGISTGNESLMINITFWTEDIPEAIEATCKMLGSDLDQCIQVIKKVLERVKVCYISVH